MNKKGQPINTMTGAVCGLHIDPERMDQYPEANYWRSGAEWAKAEIYNIFDCCGSDDKIEKILGKFYNQENSWMTICLRAEHFLSLIKILRRKNEEITPKIPLDGQAVTFMAK